MTQVIHSIQKMRQLRDTMTSSQIGFVPTMGALHSGHEELIHQAKSNNDICIVSIFVNPTQFNDSSDFKNYPNTWDSDLEMMIKNKIDYLWAPQYSDLYPDNYHFKICEDSFSQTLCGKHRPGHFDGVLTVVMKLLQVVQPTRVYFGEKDFQQLTLIQKMKEAFFLPTEIISVPTVREADGLAMSSRNLRLTPEQRKLAPKLYQAIHQASTAEDARVQLENKGFKVDYVTDLDGRRWAAATLGNVRLIDNVKI